MKRIAFLSLILCLTLPPAALAASEVETAPSRGRDVLKKNLLTPALVETLHYIDANGNVTPIAEQMLSDVMPATDENGNELIYVGRRVSIEDLENELKKGVPGEGAASNAIEAVKRIYADDREEAMLAVIYQIDGRGGSAPVFPPDAIVNAFVLLPRGSALDLRQEATRPRPITIHPTLSRIGKLAASDPEYPEVEEPAESGGAPGQAAPVLEPEPKKDWLTVVKLEEGEVAVRSLATNETVSLSDAPNAMRMATVGTRGPITANPEAAIGYHVLVAVLTGSVEVEMDSKVRRLLTAGGRNTLEYTAGGQIITDHRPLSIDDQGGLSGAEEKSAAERISEWIQKASTPEVLDTQSRGGNVQR